ncbi:pilus assembly protein TadG-related protein [Rothia sp. (in: high G+C Gram-positive bacteria)]|uniref:pilus assembly protein TadG-related protein n=1 Tax=Rothia sp. (in: high G+C Gram-positive bacteria) TaxID=1885016 RepID=UPI0025D0C9E4|nr:pilus assembly protein TadG-related protein [Rothia sp. (in: high G+C Gram-positive bacteria)]
MRRVGGLVMLIPNGSSARLLSSVWERYANAHRRARAHMQARARAQRRALASGRLDSDPLASGRLAADPLASGPEEGSIAPLIVGMLALLLLIGSVTVAITGAYLQTQYLQDVADAQANSITRTMRTPDEASGSAAWEYASAYLAEVQPGQDFQALRLENVSVDSDQSVHVYLSARIRPPLLSILVPDGIEVTAHGSSRLKTSQGPSTD